MRWGGAGGGVGLTRQRKRDCFYHSICLVYHILVPKAQYTQSQFFQECLSLRVVFVMARFIMCRAIDFNHELRFGTIEVDNKSTDRMLTTEVKSIYLPTSQILPKHTFGLCRILTHDQSTMSYVLIDCPVGMRVHPALRFNFGHVTQEPPLTPTPTDARG